MSDAGSATSRPTLARAVNEVFSASKDIFALAQRLIDVAESLPPDAGSHRSDILHIASDLASSARTIVRGQQSAVEAIGRKTVW